MLRILLTMLLPGALLGTVSNYGCSASKDGGQTSPNSDPIFLQAPVEPDLYGVVKAVDAAHRTVSLSVEKDGEKPEKSYDVATDAKILLDGPSKLADLTVGTRVGLVFDADHKAVVEVRAEPFRILVKLKKNRVEVNKPFDVELRVVNASLSSQSFQVMSCSWYEHWKSSTPRVSLIAWGCWGNVPTPVKLAPGEAYEKTLPMQATAAGLVSFQMAFTPLEVKPGSRWQPGKRTYWSTEVTIEVNQGQDNE